MEAAKRDLFDELGLEVAQGEVEIGQTYPIFGMITNFISEEPGNTIVEINHNIRAKMNVSDPEKIELLKQRSFEVGIFVSKVVEAKPKVEVECQTVIFGRQQGFNA